MSSSTVIIDRGGRSAIVDSVDGDRVRLRLPNGAALDLAADLVERQPDGSYRTEVSFEDLDPGGRQVLREIDEHVRVGTVSRETGRVVARVRTDTQTEAVDTTGWRETVDVERVPVDRVVESVEPMREEDGVTVIPVYEEVLVVQKRLVLREEVRLTTRREPVPGSETVPLRRQHVEVERLAPSDAGPADR